MNDPLPTADYDAGVAPLQECARCRVMCAPGMACVSSLPGHADAERPCRPEVVVIDITGGPLSPEERAIHAKYQSDDADADYYDGDEDCGCSVVHPRWCAWNGACCDHCTHDTTYEARYGGAP